MRMSKTPLNIVDKIIDVLISEWSSYTEDSKGIYCTPVGMAL